MPMNHDVNKNTLPSDSPHLPPHSRFSPGLFVFLQEMLDQPSEGFHLTFPPIFSVQVKFGACYITGQCGRVQNKIKET